MNPHNIADLANAISKFTIQEQAVATHTSNPALARGYSPHQFENKFRELLGRLGFSKTLPIKQVGSEFWVGFDNMPKASDFYRTLENLLGRHVKIGMKLTKAIPLDPNDLQHFKSFLSTTKIIVVVNVDSIMREGFEEYGFVAEDFYTTT